MGPIDINIPILIVGLNIEALSALDYLNRANLYNQVLLVYSEELDGESMDGPFLHEVKYSSPILSGEIKAKDNELLFRDRDRLLRIRWRHLLIGRRRYFKILNIPEPPIKLIDSHLTIRGRGIIVNPNIYIGARGVDYRRRTGYLLGSIISRILSGISYRDVGLELECDYLRLIPQYISLSDATFIWLKRLNRRVKGVGIGEAEYYIGDEDIICFSPQAIGVGDKGLKVKCIASD